MCFVFCLCGVDLCFYCCLAVGCGVFCVDLCVFLFGMLLCGFIEVVDCNVNSVGQHAYWLLFM